MPGMRDRNLRSGDLHEELGIFLLKAVALVAPVPRHKDVGNDAFATLIRPEGSRRLIPDLSFLVQLKADFVRAWADKTDIPVARFLPWIGITTSKFHDWIRRFGKVNEHNAWNPRDHWLTEPEMLSCQRLSIPVPKLPAALPSRNREEERVASPSTTFTIT